MGANNMMDHAEAVAMRNLDRSHRSSDFRIRNRGNTQGSSAPQHTNKTRKQAIHLMVIKVTRGGSFSRSGPCNDCVKMLACASKRYHLCSIEYSDTALIDRTSGAVIDIGSVQIVHKTWECNGVTTTNGAMLPVLILSTIDRLMNNQQKHYSKGHYYRQRDNARKNNKFSRVLP